jgi:hypothetical protein
VSRRHLARQAKVAHLHTPRFVHLCRETAHVSERYTGRCGARERERERGLHGRAWPKAMRSTYQEIGGLKIPVKDVAVVQVGHGQRDISGEREPTSPRQGDALVCGRNPFGVS